MELKELNEKIGKAISYQAKVNALQDQVATLKGDLETGKKRADQLAALVEANGKKETALVQVEAELARTQSEFAGYLKELEDQGITLPLGKVVKGKL